VTTSRRSLVLASAFWAVATSARGQTNDVFYRSWRWIEEPSAARAAGLAGATAAVADDVASVEANPGALTTLSKVELGATLLRRSAGRTAVGDALAARTGVGFAALAGPLTERWAVGVYLVEPHAVRIDLAPLPRSGGGTDQGFLEGTVRDWGVAAAWRLMSRLHLGARATATRLTLAGEYRDQPEAGPARLQVGTSGEATRVTGSLGALFEAGRHVVIGLMRRIGTRWPVMRTAESPAYEATVDPGSRYDLRQPSVLSGGIALRPSAKLTLIGQLDYVRYGELSSDLLPGGYARQRYDLFAWEPRAAVELSVPLSGAALQVRAGIHGRSAAGLRETTTAAAPTRAPTPMPSPTPETGAPAGPDARVFLLQQATALREPLPADDQRGATAALGASLATTHGFRFDVAVRLGGERTVVLVGGSLRF
jgi:hypothetical protein